MASSSLSPRNWLHFLTGRPGSCPSDPDAALLLCPMKYFRSGTIACTSGFSHFENFKKNTGAQAAFRDSDLMGLRRSPALSVFLKLHS